MVSFYIVLNPKLCCRSFMINSPRKQLLQACSAIFQPRHDEPTTGQQSIREQHACVVHDRGAQCSPGVTGHLR